MSFKYNYIYIYMANVNIDIKPISSKIENKLLKFVIIKGNYKELNEKYLNVISKYLKNKNINIKTVLSMRSSYMAYKIMKSNIYLINNIDKFVKLYNQGIGISELSKKYDLSPMSLLRNIFNKTKNYSKEEIKKLFLFPNNKLSNFDIEQIDYAKKNDIFNKLDQTKQKEDSEKFELLIEKFLINNNVKYKTQNMLEKEQMKKYGKSVNTPDFLILSDLKINNKQINWIDAKNFYGANTYLLKKKIKKQTRKYIKNFGYGCIIFSLNFSEKLEFNGILLIDYQNIS